MIRDLWLNTQSPTWLRGKSGRPPTWSSIPSLPHLHAEVSMGKMLNPELPLIEQQSAALYECVCYWVNVILYCKELWVVIKTRNALYKYKPIYIKWVMASLSSCVGGLVVKSSCGYQKLLLCGTFYKQQSHWEGMYHRLFVSSFVLHFYVFVSSLLVVTVLWAEVKWSQVES